MPPAERPRGDTASLTSGPAADDATPQPPEAEPPGSGDGLLGRANSIARSILATLLRTPGASLLLHMVADVARGNVTDRAMTLAAQAFTSILPIVILLTALPGSALLDEALGQLGIDPSRLDFMDSPSPETVVAFGWVGALMTIAGATSLSRALGRMYVSIWEVTKLPLSGWWRWVVVIFVIPLAVTLQGLSLGLQSSSVFGFTIADGGILGIVLVLVLTLLVWACVWTLIPRLLVAAQVPIRLLALNGVVTSIFLTILLAGSAVMMPRIMTSTTEHYGTLGIVFVAISWLFFFAAILVVAAVVVHTVCVHDGLVGRWVRRHAGVPRPDPSRKQAARWYDQTDTTPPI